MNGPRIKEFVCLFMLYMDEILLPPPNTTNTGLLTEEKINIKQREILVFHLIGTLENSNKNKVGNSLVANNCVF